MVIGCDTIESIVNRIKSGDLIQEEDEKYRDGFYDLALELGENRETLQVEEVYYLFWQIVDQFIERKEK